MAVLLACLPPASWSFLMGLLFALILGLHAHYPMFWGTMVLWVSTDSVSVLVSFLFQWQKPGPKASGGGGSGLFQLTFPGNSPSLKGVKAVNKGRNHWRRLVLVPSQAYAQLPFLSKGGLHAKGMALPTFWLIHPHQSSIKTIPQTCP